MLNKLYTVCVWHPPFLTPEAMSNASMKILLRASCASLVTLALTACDGDSVSGGATGKVVATQCAANATASNPATNQVTISGQVTFDLVPNRTDSVSGNRGSLNYDAIQQAPVKAATVQLLNQSNQVLQSATTDTNGSYSLLAPMNTVVRVRVLAQVVSTNYQYSVVDNTSNDSLYALSGDFVNSNRCDSTRNLNAASGWNAQDAGYSDTRSAAPFAILDAVTQAMEMITAQDPEVTLPNLVLNWSPNNIAVSGDKADGEITTSHYLANKIYILGHENNDTDEYDRSVIQHEFAHFLEDNLWRSDNIGGSHSLNSKLDIRLAFGEGFANAFSAMAANSSLYMDSVSRGQRVALAIDMEAGTNGEIGWYSERSTGELIYDLFDTNNDGDDTLSLGFGPLYEALSSPSYIGNPALTSIYLLTDELKNSLNEGDARVLSDMLSSHNIFGEDAFGDGETNDGGDPDNLPVYHQLDLGGTVNLCTSNSEGEYGGLGVRRFVRFTVANQQNVSISLSRTSGSAIDPDARLFRANGSQRLIDRGTNDRETHSESMAPGEYILEVYGYRNIDGNTDTGGSACFDVSIEGE